MVSKFTNLLMILIIIVIVILGGIYYHKMTYADEQYAFRPSTNQIEDTNDVQQEVYANSTTNESQTQIIIPTPEINNNIIQNSEISDKTKYPYNNRYYYKQLNEPAKALYDAVENNLDTLKTGTGVINIDYDFSTILKNNNAEDSLKPYYDDAIDALGLDVPNLFYIDFSKLWLFVETRTSLFSTKYKVYLSPKEGTNLYQEGFYSKDQINDIISQLDIMKSNFTNRAYKDDYYKLRYVHDWIIDNVEYNDNETNKANIYGVLIDNKAVCEGYARTYKYVLDELGVNNVLVTGTATNSNGDNESHMWNYVLLNGRWYAVDVTWDDPIIIGVGVLTQAAKHRYFLLGSDNFFQNHFEQNNISPQGKQFMFPTLEIQDY